MFHGRVVAEFGRGWRDDQLVAAMEGVSGKAADAEPGPEPRSVPRPEATDKSGR
jgi:simple sugar transport system ATP-binding protein